VHGLDSEHKLRLAAEATNWAKNRNRSALLQVHEIHCPGLISVLLFGDIMVCQGISGSHPHSSYRAHLETLCTLYLDVWHGASRFVPLRDKARLDESGARRRCRLQTMPNIEVRRRAEIVVKGIYVPFSTAAGLEAEHRSGPMRLRGLTITDESSLEAADVGKAFAATAQ
jgi:hypothetical protein